MQTIQEVDVLSAGMIPSIERKKTVDFAYMTWTEPYAMVVPRPNFNKERLFAFVLPFQPIVSEHSI